MSKGSADRTRDRDAYRRHYTPLYGIRRQKPLICVCGESGVGKTAIVRASSLKEVISYTTRERRPEEVDGEDYHFVSKTWFMENKSLFTYDLKEFNGELYGAADEDLEGCDVLVILLRDAIALRERGLPVTIVWVNGPIREDRGIRESVEHTEEMSAQVDSILFNVGDLTDSVRKLEQLTN